MKRLCLTLGALAALLVAASCTPRDVTIDGDHEAADSDLHAQALRPLETWRTNGHRPADLQDAAYAMESFLWDQGYPFADVRFTNDLTNPKHPQAVFHIAAGDHITLGPIIFTDSDKHDIEVENLTNFFIPVGIFDRSATPFVLQDIESATRMVERWYRANGYLNVIVDDPRITIDDDGVAQVKISIISGTRYYMGHVTLITDKEFNDDLEHIVDIFAVTGKPYHHLIQYELAAGIRSEMVAQGYLQAEVSVEQRLDHITGTANLEVTAVAGPRSRMGTLTIHGNTRTRTRFIRARLDGFDSGEYVNGTELQSGIRRLYQSGLFSQVTSDLSRNADGTDDVDITVAEAPQRGIDISIGWGSYEQLRGSVGWRDENVFGEGIRFTSSVGVSMKGWGINGGLMDRHHFGLGRSLSFDASYFQREEPSYEREETEFSTTFRHEFNLQFDPWAKWSYRTSYALSFNNDQDNTVEMGGDADEPSTYRLSTVSFGIQRDSRETKPMDPEAGTFLSIYLASSAEGLGSQVPYTEQRIRWTHLRRLTTNLVGVLNLNAAVRQPDEADNLPIGERLFLGGDDSVRSFQRDQLGPKDINGKPLGGLTTGYGNVELRLRPWTSKPNVEISTFFDMGSIGQEPYDLDWPAGYGIGLGIRYVLPVGPIRLDAAYNPGDDFGVDDPYAIHLTVGFAF